MANWGGLNNALFAWRNGVNALLPNRSTRSDGGRADSNHASTSQHQPDSDGTVDAFDEDVNYLASTNQTGSYWENRIADALDRDFMADPRWHLIIRDRRIRNDEIRNGDDRAYSGSSPHTEHTHRQVHQSMEDDGRAWKFTHTRAVLREMEDDGMAGITQAEFNTRMDEWWNSRMAVPAAGQEPSAELGKLRRAAWNQITDKATGRSMYQVIHEAAAAYPAIVALALVVQAFVEAEGVDDEQVRTRLAELQTAVAGVQASVDEHANPPVEG